MMPHTNSMFPLTLILAAAAVPVWSSPAAGQTATLPFPHPLITEILYAVPSGQRGDANGDGTRDAVGDEFIELVNPHDKPIQLKGYTLLDSDAYSPGAPKSVGTPAPAKPSTKPTDMPTDKPVTKPAHDPGTESTRAEVRFVFPELELKPGQVVVVFNGYHQKFTGPVGDTTKPPSGTNDKFHDAYVFTMKNESPYAALGNEADFVVLLDPDSKPVQVVKWGKTTKNPPKDALLTEEAPSSIGSVQREGVHGKLTPHRDLKGELAGTFCSPGVFSLTPGVDPPTSTTPTPTPPKPTTHPYRPKSKP